ncbi:MAG: hypothetical protein Ta2A_00180 [Treponemataceae bacterium]|nr:MAG: hypothetical protein Ta2A_00180 [Treponemataceae bacterium]
MQYCKTDLCDNPVDSCRSGAYPAPWGGKRVCTTECNSSGETTYPAACGGVVDCRTSLAVFQAKALQNCGSLAEVFQKLKFLKSSIVFFLFFVFCVAHNVFAQSSQQSQSKPQISAPEVSMPTVSAPSMGGSFYRPQVPGRNDKSSTKSNDNSDMSPNSAANAQNNSLSSSGNSFAGSTANPQIPPFGISQLGQGDDALNPLYNISADAISRLGDVYGSKLLNSTGLSNSFDTNTMLNTVMTRLQALENENAARKTASSQAQSAKAPFSRDNDTIVPAILRFTINGTNILSTCKTVYFSHPEESGTFLLTGDRRVVADGRAQIETFYILFNAVRDSRTGRTSFETALTVSGSGNTLLNRFADYGTASAALTGNLVSLHIDENDLRVDLLIDKGTK